MLADVDETPCEHPKDMLIHVHYSTYQCMMCGQQGTLIGRPHFCRPCGVHTMTFEEKNQHRIDCHPESLSALEREKYGIKR